MEIFLSTVLLANEHQSDWKKCYKWFSYKFFAMYLFTQKRLCQWNARKCSIKEDFNQNGSLSISLNIKQCKKKSRYRSPIYGYLPHEEADLKHPSLMYSSYLLLKTLFYFISQCTSEPYLEGGLCKEFLAIRRAISRNETFVLFCWNDDWRN